MFGLLNINKPTGMTSRRVVDRVQHLVRPRKAGHAGTLDPLAAGVLVVCVGQATRLIEYVQRMKKRYRGTFLLGRCSPTEDTEGEVSELDDPPVPTLEEIQRATLSWTGTIQQQPPAFSALKVKGRRAYELARQGQQVALLPREVTVHELAVVQYDYPRLLLEIACSSGTYVRSLGRDLAASLGTAAVMSALTRTAIGRFELENACELDTLDEENIAEYLLPAARAVDELPTLELTVAEAGEIQHGRPMEREGLPTCDEYAAMYQGRLFAILKHEANVLKPARVFPIDTTDT